MLQYDGMMQNADEHGSLQNVSEIGSDLLGSEAQI